MKRTIRRLAAFAFAVSPLAVAAHDPVTAAQAGEVLLIAEHFAELDARIAGWVTEGDPVGAELLVMQNGRKVLHRTYGYSDKEEDRHLAPGSIYRIRSMTKPILGTAVLLLRDEGRLSLDDPASAYVSVLDTDLLRHITIRQLLSHKSGLDDEGAENLPAIPPDYDSLSAFVSDLANLPRDALGEGFKYSDFNSAILGVIVSEIAGVPVEQFIEDRIFGPLGMNDSRTGFVTDAPWSARMASTYAVERDECKPERYWHPGMPQTFRFFRASGGLYSTPEDYSRFLQMWLDGGVVNGKRFLSKSSVKEALAKHADREVYGAPGGYGFHWTLYDPQIVAGRPMIFGHGGSDGTLALAFPSLGVTISFFTQTRGSSARSRFLAALREVPGFQFVRLGSDPGRRDACGDAI